MDQMGYSSVVLYKMTNLIALISIICPTVQDGGEGLCSFEYKIIVP